MFSLPRLKKKIQQLQFSRREKLAFLEDLSSLVSDGVVATQAITAMSQVSKSMTQIVALDISYGIASGRGLADGMQTWFPHTVYEIVRAGEESGTLAQSLTIATESFKRRSEVIKELVSSLFYPITVFMISLILLVFVKKTVLQSFIEIKPYDQWPILGQRLFHFGYLLENWWWFYLAFILLTLTLIAIILRTVTGKIRTYIDKLPLLYLYRDLVAARFIETLGLLLSNGIVLRQALSTLQQEASPYLAWHVLMMEFQLSSGKDNIADVLDTELLTEASLIRLRLMTQGRGIEQALISLGQTANRQTVLRVARIGRISGAIFLLLTAFMAIFIISGIYNISSILAAM